MPDQYQMTSVIRRIEGSQRSAAEVDGIVVTLGEGFLSKKSHYVVITPREGVGSARCNVDVPVDAPERKWMLQLDALITVQFAGGGQAEARKLVDAIQEADNPDQAIQSLAREWTNDFLKGRKLTKAQFIEGFLGLREDLKAHFVTAAPTVALAVTEIDIKIRGEDAVPQVIEIKLANSPVVLRDYKPDLALTVDADFGRLPGSILPYIESNSEQAITAEIRRDLRDQFRTKVKLHAWQYDVNGQVRTIVEGVVRQIAETHGREIARLMISRKAPIEGVQTTFEIKLLGEKFKQLDYPDPVQVDIDLKLTLVDLGELVRSGIDLRHLDSWATATLREAISRRLLGVNYVDLFPQFEEKLRDTRSAVADAAKSIGYDLSRFILLTNLDFHVLQRGFECRIESATFPLKLRECEVVLDIDAVLRITNKTELQRLFTQNTAITQTIADTVRNAVARTLREVSPEEFYLRFHGTDATAAKSVAERLEDAIRDACQDFKPEAGMTAHITQRADELSGVYRTLVRSGIYLQELRDPNTGITVNVKASVNSISMKHWRQFQERKPTIEQVGASFQLHVLSFLNEYARRNFKHLINAPGSIVSEHAQKWVSEKLAEEYGLGVHMDHWFLLDETAGAPISTWEGQIRALTHTLNELTTQLSSAFTEGEPQSVIDELKTRMVQVQSQRDDLYRERGAKGSIFEPMDPTFEIEEGATKLLDSGGKSNKVASGESN